MLFCNINELLQNNVELSVKFVFGKSRILFDWYVNWISSISNNGSNFIEISTYILEKYYYIYQ